MRRNGSPTVPMPSNLYTIIDNADDPNMNFVSEIESDNSLAFLDVYVTRIAEKLVTSVHRKPTFSEVYTVYS